MAKAVEIVVNFILTEFDIASSVIGIPLYIHVPVFCRRYRLPVDRLATAPNDQFHCTKCILPREHFRFHPKVMNTDAQISDRLRRGILTLVMKKNVG